MDRAVREFLTGHTSKRVCSAQRERDKPRQGVMANTLKSQRNGAFGFIHWLDAAARTTGAAVGSAVSSVLPWAAVWALVWVSK
jgi:hypothetical protein